MIMALDHVRDLMHIDSITQHGFTIRAHKVNQL